MTPGRGPAGWDERYAARPWLTEPSPTVTAACADLPPGRAVDLGAGTGRHARWLAARGWAVTAVDFSAVGTAQGRALPGGAAVTWVVADVMHWTPDAPVDLVLVAHVQLGPGLRRAAGWLAPGGFLVVAGHSRRNLTEGRHGPRDPALLYDQAQLRVAAEGLEVLRLDEVVRPDEGGPSVDLVLVARRALG